MSRDPVNADPVASRLAVYLVDVQFGPHVGRVANVMSAKGFSTLKEISKMIRDSFDGESEATKNIIVDVKKAVAMLFQNNMLNIKRTHTKTGDIEYAYFFRSDTAIARCLRFPRLILESYAQVKTDLKSKGLLEKSDESAEKVIKTMTRLFLSRGMMCKSDAISRTIDESNEELKDTDDEAAIEKYCNETFVGHIFESLTQMGILRQVKTLEHALVESSSRMKTVKSEKIKSEAKTKGKRTKTSSSNVEKKTKRRKTVDSSSSKQRKKKTTKKKKKKKKRRARGLEAEFADSSSEEEEVETPRPSRKRIRRVSESLSEDGDLPVVKKEKIEHGDDNDGDGAVARVANSSLALSNLLHASSSSTSVASTSNYTGYPYCFNEERVLEFGVQRAVITYVRQYLSRKVPLAYKIVEALYELQRSSRGAAKTSFPLSKIDRQVRKLSSKSKIGDRNELEKSLDDMCASVPRIIVRNESGYCVNGGDIAQHARDRIIDSVIQQKYGVSACRIVRMLRTFKYLDEKQVSIRAMLPPKEARAILYKLFDDSLIHIQEVPKKPDFSPQTTFYMYTVLKNKVNRLMRDRLLQAIHNLHVRKSFQQKKFASFKTQYSRGQVSNSDHEFTRYERNERQCLRLVSASLDLDKDLTLFW
eukprot:g1830.t1